MLVLVQISVNLVTFLKPPKAKTYFSFSNRWPITRPMFLLDSFSIFIDHAQKSSQSLVLHFPLDTVFSVILQGETLQVQVFYSNMKDLSFTVYPNISKVHYS